MIKLLFSCMVFKMNDRTLPEPTISDVSRIFRALGDEQRLRLLRTLLAAGRPLSQKNLAMVCQLSQANASKHLITLVSAGLVSREQQGNFVLFKPVLPLVADVCDLVCGHVTQRIRTSYEAIV